MWGSCFQLCIRVLLRLLLQHLRRHTSHTPTGAPSSAPSGAGSTCSSRAEGVSARVAWVRGRAAIGICTHARASTRVASGAAVDLQSGRGVMSCHVASCHLRSCPVAMLCRVMPSCRVVKGGHNTLTQLPHSHTAQTHAAHTHTAHVHTTRVCTAYTHTTHADAPAQFCLPAIASPISSAHPRLLLIQAADVG